MKRRRRLAATLGLVALVIVDIALVFAALRITGRSAAAETPSADGTIATATSGPEPVARPPRRASGIGDRDEAPPLTSKGCRSPFV